jgi:hypothetical protein
MIMVPATELTENSLATILASSRPCRAHESSQRMDFTSLAVYHKLCQLCGLVETTSNASEAQEDLSSRSLVTSWVFIT